MLDRFLIDLQLNVSSVFTERTTYYGIHNISQFDLSFRLQCSELNYYGPQCDRFCSGVEGQFTCDSEGNMVCDKNRDPATNCTGCLPGYDLSSNCAQCLTGRDLNSNCERCLPGWDQTSNCTKCLTGRNPKENCGPQRTCKLQTSLNKVMLEGRR